jgi:hypothetical protein
MVAASASATKRATTLEQVRARASDARRGELTGFAGQEGTGTSLWINARLGNVHFDFFPSRDRH